MPTSDSKTKDFLKKIAFLISEGIVKNQAEVIKALNWNKSVMSSVKNGNLVVPQHIYTKFNEVYKDHFTAKEEPVRTEPYREKYISLLEKIITNPNIYH